MLTHPDPPPLTVIFDPGDDVGHLRAALAAHNPKARRITIHPTTGPKNPDALAFDILAALSIPLPTIDTMPAARPEHLWQLAAAWLIGYRTTHLLILRAHLLPQTAWHRLLHLRATTGIHLSMVCHRPTLPAAAEHALAGRNYLRADAATVLPARSPLRRHRPTPPAPTRPWITLAALRHLAQPCTVPVPYCTCTTRRPAPPGPTPPRSLPRHRHITGREIHDPARQLAVSRLPPAPDAAMDPPLPPRSPLPAPDRALHRRTGVHRPLRHRPAAEPDPPRRGLQAAPSATTRPPTAPNLARRDIGSDNSVTFPMTSRCRIGLS